MVLSIFVLIFAGWLSGSLNYHFIILGILAVGFLVSWFWYLSNLKSEGILQDMYEQHQAINSWKPKQEEKVDKQD